MLSPKRYIMELSDMGYITGELYTISDNRGQVWVIDKKSSFDVYKNVPKIESDISEFKVQFKDFVRDMGSIVQALKGLFLASYVKNMLIITDEGHRIPISKVDEYDTGLDIIQSLMKINMSILYITFYGEAWNYTTIREHVMDSYYNIYPFMDKSYYVDIPCIGRLKGRLHTITNNNDNEFFIDKSYESNVYPTKFSDISKFNIRFNVSRIFGKENIEAINNLYMTPYISKIIFHVRMTGRLSFIIDKANEPHAALNTITSLVGINIIVMDVTCAPDAWTMDVLIHQGG